MILYYKKQGEIKHFSIAILFDNLKHDTTAVYEFQKIIVTYLKKKFIPIKIFYFIDDAA